MVLSSGFVEINAFVRKKQIFHSVALLGLLCRKERRETINLDGGQTNSLNNYGKIACFPLSFVLWRHWHSVSIAGGAFWHKIGHQFVWQDRFCHLSFTHWYEQRRGRKLILMTQTALIAGGWWQNYTFHCPLFELATRTIIWLLTIFSAEYLHNIFFFSFLQS